MEQSDLKDKCLPPWSLYPDLSCHFTMQET